MKCKSKNIQKKKKKMKNFRFQDKQIIQTTKTQTPPLNFSITEILNYEPHMGLAE